MKILIGKANTGKSKYIYEKLKEDLNNNKKSILFVPSQTKQIAEIEFINYLKKDGLIGVNITTISDYVRDFLKSIKIDFEKNYITAIDRRLIILRIIEENKDKFVFFKNVCKKQGFVDVATVYLDLIRKNELKLNEITLKDKVLECKLKELFMLYDSYEKIISEKFIDTIKEEEIIENYFEKFSKYMADSNIYFDNYNNFTNAEFSFIEACLKLKKQLIFSIDSNIDNINEIYVDENSIFEISNQTISKLLNLANRKNDYVDVEFFENDFFDTKPDIKHLYDNIFQDERKVVNDVLKKTKKSDIHLNVYKNPYDEIFNIAKIINNKIRNEGKKYSDFCICTNDSKEYEDIIKTTFFKYNIPYFFDVPKSLDTSKFIKYISIYFDILCYNLTIENAINILKYELDEIDYLDICYFENYVYEYNIKKYALNNEFYLNATNSNSNFYDLDKLNEIRKKIINIFSDKINEVKSLKGIKEIIEFIYKNVITSEKINKYFDKNYKINNVFDSFTIDEEKLVMSKLSTIFDSIYKIYEDKNIDFEDFNKIFKMCISNTTIKAVPSYLDQVLVVDINSSKILNKDFIYIIGCLENKLPKKYDEDILFSDKNLETLKQKNIDIKTSSNSKENMEKFNIYTLISNCKEDLYFSFPSLSKKYENNLKSDLITKIEENYNLTLVGNIFNEENEKEVYNLEDLLKNLSKINENLDTSFENLNKEEIEDILTSIDILKKNPLYKSLLNYFRKSGKLDDSTIKDVYFEKFNTTVYKLEEFSKCPFAYYLRYILNIDDRKIYTISSMDTGSLIHEVLEKFSYYLFENNISWKDVIDDNEKINEKYEQKIDDIVSNLLKNEFKNQKESIKFNVYVIKIKNTIKNVIKVISKSFVQSKFEPYGYEIEFKENGKYLPIDIELDNGVIMKIVGKIDRIDTVKVNDFIYTRIIDYKSSSKDLKLEDIKEGISLQLITYLTAFLQNKNNTESIKYLPAGMLYFNLSNNVVNLANFEDNDTLKEEVIKKLRMKGIILKDVEILKMMDCNCDKKEGRLIDFSASRLNSSKKALEQEEFNKLCNDVKIILKNIGNKMYSGDISIKKDKKHCSYCKYSNICRKESNC